MSPFDTSSCLVLKHKLAHIDTTRKLVLKLTLASFYARNELNILSTFYATFKGLVSTLNFNTNLYFQKKYKF